MDIVRSNIVKSTAGRDEGDFFFVLDTQGEFLLLADGKSRRVEKPKKKKRKHVSLRGRATAWLPTRSGAAKKSQIVSFVKP